MCNSTFFQSFWSSQPGTSNSVSESEGYMSFEMTIFWALVLMLAGLGALVKSANLLVDGSVGIAKHFGMSPLLIGLTVVAMGTSAPEVAASITAAAGGFGDLAIGNIYGSNVANLALIGGLCAIISPIIVKPKICKRQFPIMIGAGLLLWPVFSIDSYLSREESVILLAAFVAIFVYMIVVSLREGKDAE